MKIQSTNPQPAQPRKLPEARVASAPDQFTRNSQPTGTSPILRHALIGAGVTAAGTGAFSISVGLSPMLAQATIFARGLSPFFYA